MTLLFGFGQRGCISVAARTANIGQARADRSAFGLLQHAPNRPSVKELVQVNPSQGPTSGIKRCPNTEESIRMFPFVRQMTQEGNPNLCVARGTP